MIRFILALTAVAALTSTAVVADTWPTTEGNYVVKDFTFKSGEKLPELRIHYTTLGTPHRNASGEIDNGVMALHGTGGSGKSLLVPQFADELFGPDAPFDLKKTYVILPDGLGHGQSSKPSDGLRMAFPKYDYDDMVAAQHRLLVDGLGVKKLKVILGTSMGCMHAFVWGETYPGFAARLAPFACQSVEIAGRNRIWRKMTIDAIMADPAWNGGNYALQPLSGLRTSTYLGIIAGANPLAMQAQYPTRLAAEAALDKSVAAGMQGLDANDRIYQIDASRNYNPTALLGRITVPVLWINSADDFINPPELGIAQREAMRMPHARFILIPATTQTRGHGTHTAAKFWKADLAKLLAIPVSAR
jgi:homoserine O-acetyltransferase